MSEGLKSFIEQDEQKLVRILRLFQLIAAANQSIAASENMQSPSMIKQLEHQKNKFVKELNELLHQKFNLALVE
jgi:hypothetical protein